MRRSTNKNSEKKDMSKLQQQKMRETKWQDKTNKLVFENFKRTLICIRISKVSEFLFTLWANCQSTRVQKYVLYFEFIHS